MKKRIFSMLLVVCMVVSLLPANIFHVHADTVTKKPFYLVNTSAITGDEVTNSYSMPKTWTDDTMVAVGQWPRVYLLGQSDPAGCAQALADLFKDRPEGTRYFEFDMVPQVFDKLAEDRVYFDEAVVIVKEWLESFLVEYTKVGGVLDGIIVDLEYHGSHGYDSYLGSYYSNNIDSFDVVKNIVADDSYPALRERLDALGFVFGSNNETEIATAFNWYPDVEQDATSSKIWNQVMDEMERDAINAGVLEPLLKHFPNAVVSDYQAAAQRSYNETLIWHGKTEFYDNIYPAGNATNMNAYSGRGNGVSGNPDGYLGTWDTASAFNSALFEVKFAKDMLAVSQDFYGINKQHIWVGGYSYGRTHEYTGDDLYGENGGYKDYVYSGSYSETPYYAETMFHLGLTTDEPFFGYIVDDEETDKETYGGVGYQACIEIFDGILKELTAVAGSSDRKPIRTAANWNGSYILSGMYAGGRNIWRITPDNSVAYQMTTDANGDPALKIDGLTISFPGGRIVETGIEIEGTLSDGTKKEATTCGYWVETAANVEPVIVADDNRYAESTRYSSVVDDGVITTNYKVYDTVIGNTMLSSTSQDNTITIGSYTEDVDYRINWINATDTNMKGIIKSNGVEVASFVAPKGQDGVAVGTLHAHDSTTELSVEYVAYAPETSTDETIDEDFFANYIDDSHAVITVPGTNGSLVEIAFDEGETAKYYTTSDGVAAPGTSSNYNIKVEYPQDGMATVYLKGATLTATGTENALKIGNDAKKNFDLKIVVESDSTLTADAAAIEGMMNGSITITGAGKLTVTSNNSYAVKTTYKLIFKNAEFAAESKANNADINDAAVWSQNADIVIDNSIVELTAAGGACLWNGAINGTDGDFDITIKNGSTVTANSQNNAWATIGCGGTITIDESDVTINSEDASGAAGNPFASKLPVITNAHAHADGSEWDGQTFADISLFTTCSKTVVVPGTPATCTTAGTTDKISCESCGEVLSASETIAAKGHNFITRTENYVPATLEAPGSYDLVTICTDCDYVESRVPTTIAKLEAAQTANFSFYTFYNDPAYTAEGYNSTVKLEEGTDDRYYTLQAAADSGADTNYVFKSGANAYNYNLKLSWPAGGQPTLYLKNVNYTHQRNPLQINAGDVPVTIVVEGESTIFANYVNSTYNAIVNSGTAPLTITSRNDAKLTVIGEAAAAINSSAGVIFKDANVVLRGNTLHGSYGTISTAGDVVIDNSKLHMTAEASAYIKGANNISVINGSKVTTQIFFYPNKVTGNTSRNLTSAAFSYSGEFLISGSDVAFTRNNGTAYTTAGTRLFPSGKEPVLRGVIVEAGGWSGTFVSVDDTYNDYWENVKYYPGEYDAARLNSYNYFQTTACEHTGGVATCTARAVCTTCGMAYGPDPSHTYTVTDCTEDTKCTVCGEVAVAKVAEHTVVTDEAIAATCTVDGLTAGSHCSVCNKTIAAQLVVPATGHTEVHTEGKDATCYEDGYTSGISCSVCGEVIKPVEVLTKGHTVVIDPASDATCIAPGLSEGSHCSVCNTVIKAQDVTPFLPHVAGDPVQENVVAPTCTAEGSYDEVTYCKNGCNEEMSRETITVEKLPHKLTYSLVDGQNVFTCMGNGCDCDHTESYDYAEYETSAYFALNATRSGNSSSYAAYKKTVNNNAPVYFCTVDGFAKTTDANGAAADEYNYNVKAVFDGETLRIYLRDAITATNGTTKGLEIGNAEISDFACEIIVESDSTLKAYAQSGDKFGVIHALNTDGLTITSENNALLTLDAVNYDRALQASCKTTLNDANIKFIRGYSELIWIKNHFDIIDSTVVLENNYSEETIVLRDVITTADADENKKDLTITNSSVTMNGNGSLQTATILHDGSVYIDRSDISLKGNVRLFSTAPYVENCDSATWGQWGIGTNEYPGTKYTPGGDASGFAGFTTTHTCLAGDEVYSVVPLAERSCVAYMDVVNHCVVCGAEMNRTAGTAENGAAVNSTRNHTAGEEYRDTETETESYYEMVTDCSVCGDELNRRQVEKLIEKSAYFKISSVAGFTVKNTDNAPVYYTVTDGYTVSETEDTENYNIKIEFPYTDAEGNVNDTVYVYLKDLQFLDSGNNDSNNTALTIGSNTVKDFACQIVVESASTIEDYNGAIYAKNVGGLTITSANDALLTLKGYNTSDAIQSTACGVKFLNANVSADAVWYSVINITSGDLTVLDSTLSLVNGSKNLGNVVNLGSGGISIKNSYVTSAITNTPNLYWKFTGDFTIERSNVDIRSNSASMFTKNPTLVDATATYRSYATSASEVPTTVYGESMYGTTGSVGHLVSVHTCGGGTAVHYLEPEEECAEFWDEAYKCVVCSEYYGRTAGSNREYEEATAHNFGDWERVDDVVADAENNGSYHLVRECSACGAEEIDNNNGAGYTVYKTKSGEIYIRGTKVFLTNDGTEYYYTVSGTTVTRITDPALYNTYNVKVVYPNATDSGEVNNTVYVYLKALNLDSSASGNYGIRTGVTSTVRDFACHIIVESASTIYGYNGSIVANNNGGLTISSVNDALLTLDSSQNTAKTIQTTQCGLTLLNANIQAKCNWYQNVQVVGGDFIIQDSKLDLINTANTTDVVKVTDGGITIINSYVDSKMPEGKTPNLKWTFTGNFTIERSDVDIRSNSSSMFTKNPTLVDATATYRSYATSASEVPTTVYGESMYGTTGSVGHFVSVHTCGGEAVLTEPAPEAVCAKYYLLVTNCATCGEHLSTVESDVVYNENPAPHVAGEPVKENVDTENNTYDLVTYCTNCGVEMDRESFADANTTVTATFKGTSLNVKKNDEFVYYTVSDAGVLSATDEAAGDYNLKAIFKQAENKLYVYFNNLTVDVASGSTKCLEIGSSSDKSFAAEIVVESTSSLRGAGSSGTAGAINSVVTEGLTIRSANSDAKLTLYTNNSTPLMSLGCDLTLVNANIEIQDVYYAAIRVVGDLLIDNSNVNLVMLNKSLDYMILLSSNYNSTDTTTNGNITVRNSKVTSGLIYNNARNSPVWGFGGKLTIERSDVEISANNKAFSTDPYIVDGTHSEIKVADYAQINSEGVHSTGSLSNYDATSAGTASSIGYFKSTHTCGGVETLVETVEHPCRKYNVYEITCAVYGCDKGFSAEKIVESEEDLADHTWGAGVESGRQDATSTQEGYVEYLYTCTECGDTKTEQETIPVLKNATFHWYSATNAIEDISVVEGDAEQLFVMQTGSNGLGYLTESADSKYVVKVVYPAGGVPTLYLNGLTMDNAYGIAFESAEGLPVNVIVEADSTIEKSSTEGSYYYKYPALNFITTGDATITSVDNALLTLKSTCGQGEKADIASDGNLIFENANIAISGDDSPTYGDQTASIYVTGGDFIVKGGTLVIADDSQMFKQIKVTKDAEGNGGNVIIRDGANVTSTRVGSDTTHSSYKPLIDTEGVLRVYSDSTVSLAGHAQLFRNIPEIVGYCTHTSVTESNLASTQIFTVTPAPCPHDGMVAFEAVDPNCSEDGNSAYWYCGDCFKYFSDADGNVEIKEGDWVLKADGNHVHGENWVKLQNTVVNATCNSTGSYQLANMCTKCGIYEYEEDRKTITIPVNDEGHVWVEVDGTRVEPTAQAFGSATFECSKCGDEKTDRIAAKFYGTNVDLGNSLDMNFYFRCDLDGVDYSKAYAIIVRHYANGLTKEEKVMLTDCGEPSGKYYIIKYTGIAAKEMNDLVEVTVYDGNNVAISETKSESIKTYAMRVLEKYTADNDANAKIRTLIADMLNYGAAMQTYFSYDVENLASAGVDICAERANAAAAEFTNNQSSSNNSYYGASFTMKSDISMNLYVLAESIDAEGKAVITYKNFRGVDQAFEITESKLVGRYYVFNMDALIVADARQDINIKFYDASGNLVVDVTESMECYMARWAASGTTGSEHADEVIKFTDSATAYLTK